jgi:hypothetical protein
MLGAAYTHVFRGTWMIALVVPLLFLAMLAYVAARAPRVVATGGGWLRRRRVYTS